MKKIFDALTDDAKSQLIYLVKNKENAIDMIANNYFGEESHSSKDIVNRFQIQYFALDPKMAYLQTEGKDGWWQNEEHEANTVNKDISPLIQTETTEKEWGKSYYSSFSLNKEGNNYFINFPLKDDYLTSSLPFKFKDMGLNSYEKLVGELQNKLSINITSTRYNDENYKKTSFVYQAFAKIKNGCLKLFRKFDKISSVINGNLYISDRSKSNYTYSNVEKVVKIYDTLFAKVINRKNKALKDKANRALSKDITFASRIFADMLMCRITDFGDIEINKKVEKCLALQFANIINKNSFSSNMLNIITEMATGSVCDLCKKMGYSTEDITNKMIANGFVYESSPSDEKEALLLAKEKDYSVYMDAMKNPIEEIEKEPKLEEMGIVADEIAQKPAKQEKEKVAIVPKMPELKSEEKSDGFIKTTVAKLEPKNEIPALNSGREIVQYKDEDDVAKLLESGEEMLKLPSGKSARVLEYGEIAGLLGSGKKTKVVEPQIEALEAPAALSALPEGQTQKQLEGVKIAGYLPEGNNEAIAKENLLYEKYNTRFPIELDRLPFLNKIIASVEEKISKKKLSKKTLTKYIDKQVEKTLVDYIVKITNAINANRCAPYGGKVKAKRQADVLAMVLAYYKKRTGGVLKTTKSSKKNFATLYSRCQQLTSMLFCFREDIANKILSEAENTPVNIGESSIKYINRLAKEVCKVGDVEGVDIKTYFTKAIDSYSSIYADGEFTDIYDKDKKQ